MSDREASPASMPAADPAGNRCKICNCAGFAPDPNDESVCIAFSMQKNARCGHPILNHPPQP
jgi:hypothetical protein